MVLAEFGLTNGKAAAEKRFRIREAAHALIAIGECDSDSRGVQMIGSKDSLGQRQRFLIEGNRLRVLALILQHRALLERRIEFLARSLADRVHWNHGECEEHESETRKRLHGLNSSLSRSPRLLPPRPFFFPAGSLRIDPLQGSGGRLMN